MKRQLMELAGRRGPRLRRRQPEARGGRHRERFTFYSGQICTAPTRVLASGIYDELIGRLGAWPGRCRSATVDPATVVGPVISAAHRERGRLRRGRRDGGPSS